MKRLAFLLAGLAVLGLASASYALGVQEMPIQWFKSDASVAGGLTYYAGLHVENGVGNATDTTAAFTLLDKDLLGIPTSIDSCATISARIIVYSDSTAGTCNIKTPTISVQATYGSSARWTTIYTNPVVAVSDGVGFITVPLVSRLCTSNNVVDSGNMRNFYATSLRVIFASNASCVIPNAKVKLQYWRN